MGGFRKGMRLVPKHRLEKALRGFFQELGVPEKEWLDRGLDINNTPKRVARMYRDELLSSYQPGAEARLINRFTCFDVAGDDSMVTEGPITFTSLCAHHMLPFEGEAWVGYIPGDVLIGASKFARVVEHYSRMLQIQERMTQQIARFLAAQAGCTAVLVLLRAKHLCMTCRGVRQGSARMATTAVLPKSIVADRRDIITEFYEQIRILGT